MNAATPPRLRVFVSRQMPPAVEEKFAERYDLVRSPTDLALSAAELAEAGVGCDYIFIAGTDQVTRLVFEKLCPTLKAVMTLSVGYNHIDLAAAKEFGVVVLNSPGVLTNAVAELAVMLLLNAARHGHEAEQLARSGQWRGFAPTQLMGIGLSGRRAGILGMGRIGQAIARRLKAFEIEVHYHNRRPLSSTGDEGATFHDTAESLLAISDFLLLCAPATPELKGFLNRERIAQLPTQAIVINVSRGDLVDDDSLIEALETNRIYAAGLDVFANEPKIDPRYSKLSNLFMTPHIGSATVDARNAMGFILLDGIRMIEAGGHPDNQL